MDKKNPQVKSVGEFQLGFGNLDGEYWLGLEHLYWMTKQAQYKLRVMLEDWQGRQVFAEYDGFRLEAESDWYRLRLGQYSGNAGDSLSWHNNKAFTTLDRDKDSYTGLPSHSVRTPPPPPSPAVAVSASHSVSRKLRPLPERGLVVPHVRPFQPERSVVSGGTLSKPLPRRGLLGRVPRGGLLPQTSLHDDQTHIA